MKQYDAIIIGFGKGGKTLAGALAGAGKTVALVERSEKMYGGTCINVACIPSKSLDNSAQQSKLFGGGFEEKSARYREAIAQKDRLTAMLRQKNFDKLDKNENITVITGTASFTDAHTVSVKHNGNTDLLWGENIFINTGARPFVPPIPGLCKSRRVFVSETFMDVKELPRRLVIIGGGYIGLEFASFYENFGSKVTIVQDGPVFLPREDREIAQAVQNSLNTRGVRVLASAKVEKIEDTADDTAVTIETQNGQEVLHADAVLVATGRRPNTDGLHLEKAGVALTERGAVQTDEHLRTTVPNIWAMGDVAGGLQFTYISLDDYRIVKSQLLGDGGRTTKNRGAVPYSVFLSPPLSRVGLSEEEARRVGYTVQIARLSVSAIPKAQVLKNPEGLLKAVVEKETGRILGAHLFCEESHEMINTIKIAMDAGLPYPVLRDSIYTHPTMSEALNDLFSTVQ